MCNVFKVDVYSTDVKFIQSRRVHVMIFKARVFVLGRHCTHPDPEIMVKEAAHSVTTANYPQFGQLSFVFYEEILSNPGIVFNRNMFHDIRLLSS